MAKEKGQGCLFRYLCSCQNGYRGTCIHLPNCYQQLGILSISDSLAWRAHRPLGQHSRAGVSGRTSAGGEFSVFIQGCYPLMDESLLGAIWSTSNQLNLSLLSLPLRTSWHSQYQGRDATMQCSDTIFLLSLPIGA